MELDARWTSPQMSSTAKEVWDLMKEIDAQAEKDNAGLPPEELRQKSEELFAKHLAALHKANDPKYQNYIDLISFFETMGYVAKKKYLSKGDALDLFGGVILSVGRVMHMHIRTLQARPGTTGLAWEHTLWLIDEMREKERRVKMRNAGAKNG